MQHLKGPIFGFFSSQKILAMNLPLWVTPRKNGWWVWTIRNMYMSMRLLCVTPLFKFSSGIDCTWVQGLNVDLCCSNPFLKVTHFMVQNITKPIEFRNTNIAMKIYEIIEILNITKFIIYTPRNTDTFRFILIWTKKTSTPPHTQTNTPHF